MYDYYPDILQLEKRVNPSLLSINPENDELYFDVGRKNSNKREKSRFHVKIIQIVFHLATISLKLKARLY